MTSLLLGVQGYIGYNALNSTIILAFRGSSNIPNWIVDFAFPLSHFDGLPSDVKVQSVAFCGLFPQRPFLIACQVHWGFYQAFSRLKMQSRAAVARIIEVCHFTQSFDTSASSVMCQLDAFFSSHRLFYDSTVSSSERLPQLHRHHINRPQLRCCSGRAFHP
jgi:hypothetical protein